ncbi:MAG: 4-alpha-glucanotransferase [Oscillospiraceae bacterium]|nr:4-alpha-glucanotransferase [Oscillospiraceae bacterium]MDY3065404.1 4-alpha-glucanotransferase [Oscillospiraceae bacterium]
MRESGILMHLSSLPSPYGIGTMGREAYRFADFLVKAGQKVWQVLPVTPTGYGDSPYQSFSTYAGNPYFIDLDLLCKDGLLKKNEYASINWGEEPCSVDYEKLFHNRFSLLKKASARFFAAPPKEYEDFVCKQTAWLEDYALFMSLKDENHGAPWYEWPEGVRRHQYDALQATYARLYDDVLFWRFVQFEFYKQWNALKTYVNNAGIEILGDLPIYVAHDSADVWAHPELFELDGDLAPVEVAGCPPDYFSETGQLWGNPVYNWDVHKANGYSWWLSRIAHASQVYDRIRIDHFRGFESFWAIPAGDETAVNGCWKKGPGMDLFSRVNEQLHVKIIAEDLGLITPEVRTLLRESGYPGMKVLAFAFTPGTDSDYLPFHYDRNCVCYTGTHDNETLTGWLHSLSKTELSYVKSYTRSRTIEDCVHNVLALAWGSPADTAIAQIQDFIGLGNEARMNTPSTPSGNWRWRARKEQMNARLAAKIHSLTKLYWR